MGLIQSKDNSFSISFAVNLFRFGVICLFICCSDSIWGISLRCFLCSPCTGCCSHFLIPPPQPWAVPLEWKWITLFSPKPFGVWWLIELSGRNCSLGVLGAAGLGLPGAHPGSVCVCLHLFFFLLKVTGISPAPHQTWSLAGFMAPDSWLGLFLFFFAGKTPVCNNVGAGTCVLSGHAALFWCLFIPPATLSRDLRIYLKSLNVALLALRWPSKAESSGKSGASRWHQALTLRDVLTCWH